MQLEILYRDESMLFINKPTGLIVHKSNQAPDAEIVMKILRDQIGRWVYPVHRLDRGTSGVLGFGLSSEATAELQKKLDDVQTQKWYLALVRGEIQNYTDINTPLTNEEGRVQEARSEVYKIVSSEYCSLVKVRIHTGRQHQVRRHLSSLAHHVLGDRTHGKKRLNDLYKEKYFLNRIFLHAFALHLPEGLKIVASLPNDLKKVLTHLEEDKVFPLGTANQMDNMDSLT